MPPLVVAVAVGQLVALVVFVHEGILEWSIYRATRSPELRIYAVFSLWSALFTVCFLVFLAPLRPPWHLLSLHAITVFGVLVTRSYMLAIDAFLRAESRALRLLSNWVLVVAVWPLASAVAVVLGFEPFFVFPREREPIGIVVAFVNALEPRNQVHPVHAACLLVVLAAVMTTLLRVVLRTRPRDPFIVAGVVVTCLAIAWELLTLAFDFRYGIPVIFAANLIELVRITYVSMLRAGHDKALLEQEIARQFAIIEGQREALAASAPLANLGILTREVGHELKNPLASALLFVQAAERRAGDGRVEPGLLENARTALLHASTIASILGHDRRPRELDAASSCGLSDAVQDALAIARPRLAVFGPNVAVAIADDLLLRGQRSELVQIVLNLILNASDACENLPSAWLRIEARDRQGTVELIVADAGPRPSESVAVRMFQPDFTTKAARGTGLGLAITREILRRLGGRIRLDPGESNTCFVVDLKSA